MKTYEISEDGKAIRCLTCERTSWNRNDVIQRYCGCCHKFHEQGKICDFCMGEYPLVLDVVAKGRFKGHLDDGRPVEDADGIWCACKDCAELVSAEKWGELMERALDGALVSYAAFEIPDREKYRKNLMIIYRGVFGEKFTVTA